MKVEVKLYGTLRRFRPDTTGDGSKVSLPHHPFVIEMPTGATVAELATALKIPEGMVPAAAVNEEAVDIARSLEDGDRVGLFPPTAGGLPRVADRRI